MTTKNEHVTTVKMIPLSQIHIDEAFNARRTISESDIEEMAQSLKENGLKQPIGVVNGGEGKKPYMLTFGNTRYLAAKRLGWDEIAATVSKDADAAVVDNLVENIHRKNIDRQDLALRLVEMLEGKYPVPAGQKARVWTKEELMEKFSLGKSQFNNLVRAAKMLLDNSSVQKKLRGKNPPERCLYAWAALTKKELVPLKDKETGKVVKDDKTGKPIMEEVFVPDVDKQLKAIDAFIEERKALEEADRERATRKDKGKKGKKKRAEEVDPILAHARVTEPAPEERRPGRVYVADYLAVMQAKAKDLKGTEEARMQGAIDAVRWLTGELERCPFVTKAEIVEATTPEEVEADEE